MGREDGFTFNGQSQSLTKVTFQCDLKDLKELAWTKEADFNLLTYHRLHWTVSSLKAGPMIYSSLCSKQLPQFLAHKDFETYLMSEGMSEVYILKQGSFRLIVCSHFFVHLLISTCGTSKQTNF